MGTIFHEVYLFCVTIDLSDNLTEMRIVKNSFVTKKNNNKIIRLKYR